MAWDYRCSEHEVPERWLDTASAWEGRGGADEVSVLRLRAEGSHAERDFGVALVPSGIGDGDCGGEPHLRMPTFLLLSLSVVPRGVRVRSHTVAWGVETT